MRDYSKGQIYIIRNHVDDRVYIGSTTRTLGDRFSNHKSKAKSQKYKNTKLYDAFEELGVDKFYIERLEEYPCNDIQALVAREGYYIRMYDSVNDGLNGKLSGQSAEERRARNNKYFANRRATDPEFRNRTNACSRRCMAQRQALMKQNAIVTPPSVD